MESVQLETAIVEIARKARAASRNMASLPTSTKNTILLDTASALQASQDAIIAENQKDLEAAKDKGLSGAMLDRLAITEKVIADMVQGIHEIAALEDPVGEIQEMRKRPSGISVGRMRVPLGVICMIYESRPNVTIDSAALCLKAGNVVVLRGGSEAIHSNLALAGIMQDVLQKAGVDQAAVQVLPYTDRTCVDVLLQQEEYIDLVIPRGGEGLIRAVTQKSMIPVLKHYKGVCHVFIDRDAEEDMAVSIVVNGKTHRPGVCNALEGMLIHEACATEMLPVLATALKDKGVQLLGCPKSCAISDIVEPAAEEDWGKEFLDLILVVKIVSDMDEAMDYIAEHGSLHTETIITNSYQRSQRFLREVDASAVMVNASTRFNDGGQFGLGAEIGISTTKLHAYGPMGLKELTTQKFIVFGQGEIRS
ncbi:glutamate-5-semialdehyde dehydrogenase [Desulfogranum marinum]|uniref:glutamate-5-semialdehyde dehydrogenase n=1 Tax=Desulfogranum marinum TaxID=453220 RepID=UPI0019637A1E|nr:glutamate-5-semialdehyde dehydrogenase [Desulfogranum marinum]MBM9513413.1 glutamate-5-semialdehyde dehydrogenase [Desulfogranum marinum]